MPKLARMKILDWLKSDGQDQFSVDRLKVLYAELLQVIDNSSNSAVPNTPADGRRKTDASSDVIASPGRKRVSPLQADHEEEETATATTVDTTTIAFRLLSATPAPEGDNGGALALRDDTTAASMNLAQKMELHVTQVISAIGEIVAYGDEAGTSFRADPVFEYFCEKNLLSLLVDIVKSKPSPNTNTADNILKLHPVTYSAMVKAQVMSTISVLVTNAQDGPSLFYLLSNNSINELTSSIVPLRQWTDPALELMLPSYVGLLQSLVLQLAAAPQDIFTFLIPPTNDDTSFPLLASVVDVATNPRSHARSSTCLYLVVNLLQISHPSVRSKLEHSQALLSQVCQFVAQKFLDRFHKMSKLLTGPVVDPVLCHAMLGQLQDVTKQVDFMNQLLRCGVKALNVQFCETLLRQVVAQFLENLVPKQNERFLSNVGVSDVDVIPEPEAMAQLSMVLLSHLLSIAYAPLVRMISVALLHPKSTLTWKKAKYKAIKEEYALTRELNAIAASQSAADVVSSFKNVTVVENPYRRSILSLLAGDTGEWMLIPASILMETAVASLAMGREVLMSFGLIPSFSCTDQVYPDSPLEQALATFLLRDQTQKSTAATMALERVSSLSTIFLSQLVLCDPTLLKTFLPSSPLVNALSTAHGRFCKHALSARQKTGVADLFVELTQFAIQSRYSKLSAKDPASGSHIGCVLDNFNCQSLYLKPEILVRKYRTVCSNDVEDCRFAIQMALQFRATCKVISDILKKEKRSIDDLFPSVDWADELLLTIGDLQSKPVRGNDLDLSGRMTFNFQSANPTTPSPRKKSSPFASRRNNFHSDDLVLHSSNHLVLVLDPTDLFVVKPMSRREVNRGTIVCAVSLRSVIAFASDKDMLHIAIRNMDDIGFLIKNGNMALHFDTIGTCLIVKQYLERSQSNLRNEIEEKMDKLFHEQYGCTASDEGGTTFVIARAPSKDGNVLA